MITVLNESHLPLFIELKENNPGYWKLGKYGEKEITPTKYFLEVLCLPECYTVGYIVDDKLLSIGTLMENIDSPSWHLLYYSTVKTPYNNFAKTGTDKVFSALFQESFKRKLSSCYIFTRYDFPLVSDNALGNMKNKLKEYYNTVIPEIGMFEWLDEYIVPAGTTPKYNYIQWLMGYAVYPFDLRLRRGSLKKEFRKDILFT